MKVKISVSILSFILLLGFVSCLNDDDDTTSTVISSDAQIYSFSLATDSIASLANTTFSIDQLNGLIYNSDSLPYGTKLSKVLCSITSNAGSIAMMPEATKDTINWTTSDSIDFSQPVKLVVYSRNGVIKKTYTARLNVHQQEGDRISWTKLTDKVVNRSISSQKTIMLNDVYYTFVNLNGTFTVYSSLSGSTWIEQSLVGFPVDGDLQTLTVFSNSVYVATTTGEVYGSENARRWSKSDNAPSVKTFIGSIPELKSSPALLCALTNVDGEYRFSVTSDMTSWNTASNSIPSNFPVSGFGSASDLNVAANYVGLIVAGGKTSSGDLLNTTWRTSDGMTWVQLADEKATNFHKKEGVALAFYSDRYYLIGGINDEGAYTSDMYVSDTKGVTWTKADSLNSVTDLYSPRAYASVCVAGDNKLILFGGTNGGTSWLDDVWSGFLNKLGFIIK